MQVRVVRSCSDTWSRQYLLLCAWENRRILEWGSVSNVWLLEEAWDSLETTSQNKVGNLWKRGFNSTYLRTIKANLWKNTLSVSLHHSVKGLPRGFISDEISFSQWKGRECLTDSICVTPSLLFRRFAWNLSAAFSLNVFIYLHKWGLIIE
jgi:hypothetical protein